MTGRPRDKVAHGGRARGLPFGRERSARVGHRIPCSRMAIRWIGALLAVAAVTSGAQGQQEAASQTLETLVVQALRDEDWQVRKAAALLLGVFGTEQHADELQGLLGDERRDVRGAAWYSRLLLRPHKIERAIGCIADGATWVDVSPFVTHLTPLVQPAHAEVLTAEFERAKSPDAQYALLLLLAKVGAQMPEPAAAYARMCAKPTEIFNASALLPLLPDTSEHRDRVTGWLDQDTPLVRHRCAAWLLRHGATGNAIERHIIPDYVEVEDYRAESQQAAYALGAQWMPTTRAAVLDAVGRARIVLVGDSHGSKSIADLTADCCAASIAGTERGTVAFGYEAPVEMSFALAKPRAEALGLAAVPLEPAEQLPSLRARDAAVNAAIRAWLDRSPNHKIVALYGHNHVLGRGHIDVPGAVRILTCRPAYGLLRHLRAQSLASGVLAVDADRWFAHPTEPSTFFVICDDRTWNPETRPAFTAWLANRLRK